MASGLLSAERAGHTLQPTVLVNEALVEHARSKGREKLVELSEDLPGQMARALQSAVAGQQVEPVPELRFFAGLPREEVAEVLGVSNATIGRDWRAVRALLSKYMLEEEATAR